MSAHTSDSTKTDRDRRPTRRISTETKSSYKTTELIAYVVTALAVLIAAALVDENEDGQGFGADRAWMYVTILTVGYMVSRGLAKAGSREAYDDDSRN